jgi:hypothetical protein
MVPLVVLCYPIAELVSFELRSNPLPDSWVIRFAWMWTTFSSLSSFPSTRKNLQPLTMDSFVFEEILAHNDAEDYRRIRRSSFQREAATNENRCSRYSSRGCLGTIWRSIWPDHSHLGHFAIPEVVS